MGSEPILRGDIAPEDAEAIRELSRTIGIASAARLKNGHEKKYCMVTPRGEKRLLRINDTAHYDWLEGDFRLYAYAAEAGLNITRPVSMGKFREGKLAYQLYTWFEGTDLLEALPRMSDGEQYSTGRKAGRLMKEMHALLPMGKTEPWETRFGRKVEDVVAFVRDNPGASRYGTVLADYLDKNRALLRNRPLAFTHGDWNPENLMLTSDGGIGIIDLSGENDYGDPWWEFRDIRADAEAFSAFYTGQMQGYFDGEPPAAFFRLLSYYVAYGALEYLTYREEGDEGDGTVNVMKWFDALRNPVPAWYALSPRG